MKVLCVTIGSAGDVHPFVGIGIEMLRRGHDVTVVTNGYFRPLVEKAGLTFIELDTAERYLQGIQDPTLWHRTKAFKRVMEWGVLPLVRPTYEIVAREYVPAETVVVASSLALGCRIAQEKLGVPTVMCHLSPALFRSLLDPPVLPGLFMPAWFPRFVKNGLMWLGDNRMIDPVIGPAITSLQKELGLPPAKHFLRNWWHTEPTTLALFPKWFATAPDWPAYVKQTNFPLYDEAGVSHMSPEVSAFIDAGDPPIAFTAGSAMVHGREFFRVSVDAARGLNRRALLLTKHPEQLPPGMPPTSVMHVPYAPFSELLPRCAALVHHGGIGTTAQALRAGIPQLIYPMAHDQPDNANRLKRLGVGRHLRPIFYNYLHVGPVLDQLLNDPQVRASCEKVKARFEGAHPLAETCDEIEKIVGSSATLSRT